MNLKEGVFAVGFIATLFSLTQKDAAAVSSNSTVDIEGNMPLKKAMMAGGQLALEACRDQFFTELWQCPLQAFANMVSGEPATREQAFVNAITSAGITYAITRSCSQGILEDCTCSSRVRQDLGDAKFRWEGCSDDVTFADSVITVFFKTRMSEHDDRGRVFWHNLRAGSTAVKRSIERVCNCEGPYESCTTKTCWSKLTNFTVIAEKLKKMYRRSIKLKGVVNQKVTEGNPRSSRGSSKNSWNGNLVPSVGLRKLVYLDQSPNYCTGNETMGWSGALGRECLEVDPESTVTKSMMKPCRRLCRRCGLSIERQVKLVTVACNCNFVWCCRMVCDNCVKEVVKYTCTNTTASEIYS